ncbi:phosphoenolpyruvate--protein phosphotransferase [Pontiellaceae bacterium B1224]|nr:phosphoenolpyruvate--protein phosphotransferase [Pontiellaceae bacterium B1224]
MPKEPIRLKGKKLSGGLGCGEAFVYEDVMNRTDEFYDIEDEQVFSEIKRLHEALKQVSSQLEGLANDVREEMDTDLSDVFQAHRMIIEDQTLQEEVEREVSEELMSAGSAVKTVFRRWERRFQSMEAKVGQQKSDDIRDLARQLISALAGVRRHAFEELPEGCILVANRLLPSDTLFLMRRDTAGVLLEEGGAGSHAALFANEIGLPCLAGLENIVQKVKTGDQILIDAGAQEIIIHPSQEDQQNFEAKCEDASKSRSLAIHQSTQPAVTKQGVRISVFANVGSADDTRKAVEMGAEGIGLYRIERIYLNRNTPPGANEMYEELKAGIEPIGDRSVYIRLLDAGADKPLPFMEQLRESNPALGLRGIRFLENYPELLDTQLEVLLRLSADFDLHILVPMVTLPQDMELVKERLDAMADKIGTGQILPIGAMIETPAAALSAKALAEHVDFLSFGTNDLTQYAFAADRENAAVDTYFDDTHAAVFRMLEIVHSDLPDIPLSVCGELAGRPEAIRKLLACGVTTLSVAPPRLPETKQAVRQSD